MDKRFCSGCGEEMEMKIVPAENFRSFGSFGSYFKYRPYNEITGKRQYVREYICKRWIKPEGLRNSEHDKYMIDEIVYE